MTRQIEILEKDQVGEDVEIDWDKDFQTTKQDTLAEQTLQDHISWHCDGIWESIKSMHHDWDGVQITIVEHEDGRRLTNISILRKK